MQRESIATSRQFPKFHWGSAVVIYSRHDFQDNPNVATQCFLDCAGLAGKKADKKDRTPRNLSSALSTGRAIIDAARSRLWPPRADAASPGPLPIAVRTECLQAGSKRC
jgi:hypothetical protein